MWRGLAGGLWQAGCALQRQLPSCFEAVDSCSRQSCSHGWPRECFWQPLQTYPNRPAHLAPVTRHALMELLTSQVPAHQGRSRGFGEGPHSGLWLSLLMTYLPYFVLLTCRCVCVRAAGRRRDGDSDSRLKHERPMANTWIAPQTRDQSPCVLPSKWNGFNNSLLPLPTTPCL